MTFVFKDNKIIGIWAYRNGWEPFGKMKNSVKDMALNIVFKFPSVIKIQEKKIKEPKWLQNFCENYDQNIY